jgi:hypothetical protein
MNDVPDATVRSELLAKYEEIARLRQAVAAGGTPADEANALRALAARFPGALRELDVLPPEELAAILQALREPAPASASVATPSSGRWETFRTLHAFHAAWRGALEAKRWLGNERAAGAEHAAALLATDLSVDAKAWADEIAQVAKPPGGRLGDLVVRRLARAGGHAEETIRERVTPRRTGRRGA